MENRSCDALELDKQICFPFYAASREIIKLYRPFLEPLDLTYTQYITMMALWENESMNVRELGSRLFLDSGTLTPLLKKLENKGYIKRSRSKEDERNLIVALTDAGEALKDKALHIPTELAKHVRLNMPEIMSMYQSMYKLLEEVEE